MVFKIPNVSATHSTETEHLCYWVKAVNPVTIRIIHIVKRNLIFLCDLYFDIWRHNKYPKGIVKSAVGDQIIKNTTLWNKTFSLK